MGKRHSALGDLPQGTFVLLHTILENGHQLEFITDEEMIGMTVSDPVSYTHLYVYKRQTLCYRA